MIGLGSDKKTLKNSLFQVEKNQLHIQFANLSSEYVQDFTMQKSTKLSAKISVNLFEAKKSVNYFAKFSARICTSFCGAKKQCKFFHNNVRKFLHLQFFCIYSRKQNRKKWWILYVFVCCMWPWWIVMGARISIFCHDCIKVTHSGMPSPCCLVHLELQQGGRSITPRTILYANQPFHPTTQPLNHYPKVNHHALRHPTKVAPGQPLLSTILLHPHYQHQRCS